MNTCVVKRKVSKKRMEEEGWRRGGKEGGKGDSERDVVSPVHFFQQLPIYHPSIHQEEHHILW